MAALVLLCGCGRSAEMSAEDVRAHFASLDSCTAHLKIISDLDESVLEFESDYVYNREDSDSFTLTAPESVAGIGGRISGEENGAFTLQYNDLVLSAERSAVRCACTGVERAHERREPIRAAL